MRRQGIQTGRTEPKLVLALNKAGGLSDEFSALTDEEIHGFANNVTKGDPARGEIIFRKKELSCVMCHAQDGRLVDAVWSRGLYLTCTGKTGLRLMRP